MSLKRLPMLAATVASLVVAGSANAVTGAGVSAALESHTSLALALTGKKTTKNQTCQAQSRDKKALPSKVALVGNSRKYAVVACEQPPRSQFVNPLTKASAAALATLG
jgi:hypothetical protein